MTIGQKLSEQRRKLGKSLKEVEADLRIRVKYLENLENDRFDLLPGEAYVRAFLRTYSSYLGLNADSIIDEYESLYTTENETKPPFLDSFPIRSLLRILTIAFLGTIIAIAAWLSIPKKEPIPRMPAPPVEEISTPTLENQKHKLIVPQKETTPAPVSNQENNEQFKLTLKVDKGGRCWVRVKTGNETVFEKTLEAGESKTLDLATTVTVRLGNPAAVRIYINDKEITGFQKKGIVDLIIDSTGIKLR